MTSERETWIRHFFYLALFAALFHSLQFFASLLIWIRTDSAVLMSYGLDAAVSAMAALVLAGTIQREWRKKFVAYGYMEWWDYLNANPNEMATFGEAMKSNSLNSLRGVLEKCDFTTVKKVVDVGGGFGHLVIALLEKYRNLAGVLLDVADLIPLAKKSMPVSDASVASRLEHVGADMFEAVPAADAYVLKHIIHDWDDEHCVRLLRNCHQSMESNGRLICVDTVLPPMGDTGGTAAKLLDILMLLAINGKERTKQQWDDLYRASGFRIASITPLHDNFGTSIIEGAKL